MINLRFMYFGYLYLVSIAESVYDTAKLSKTAVLHILVFQVNVLALTA